MQQHTKAALAVNGLLFACFLSACQPEQVVNPNGPISTTSPSVDVSPTGTELSATRFLRHKLIKHGDKKLYYNADDRLWKVVDSPTEYTEYSYKPNEITAVHLKNGQQTSQVIYTLDANGRCIKSKHTAYVDTKTYKYEYNAQGRLTKRYNENAVNERHEYEYDGNSELSVFRTFDSGNIKGFEIIFGYSVPNEAVETDRYRVNSLFLYPLDEHLPIFGAFNKNLVRRITYKACGNNDVVEYLYNYTLNNDGLVTEQKMTNMVTNALVSKTAFAYSGYSLIPIN